VSLMLLALEFLTQRLAYDVPSQDLHIPPHALPPLPKDRMRIRVRALR
jgi:hypothetical protein